MKRIYQNNRCRLTRKDIDKLSCFCFFEDAGLLASTFSHFPLHFKRHCVQMGEVARLMARHVPDNAVPDGLPRDDYVNAVRYGSLHHDIGAYLVHNHQKLYPAAGERFLREQISEREVCPELRRVILETVLFCGEQYDGQGYPDKLSGGDIPLHAGICAIANTVDEMISDRYRIFMDPVAHVQKHITENIGRKFAPDAAACFSAAYTDIAYLYKHWRKNPPFWKHGDIKPLSKPADQTIG